MKLVIAIDEIIIDERIQPRAEGLNEGHVEDLMEACDQADAEIPPLRVFNVEGRGFLLTRGFHRHEAYRRKGRVQTECEVKDGTQAEAELDAAMSNRDHGLKRSVEDKRAAVLTFLKHHVDWSDRRIAESLGVSQPFVSGIRTDNAISRKVVGKDGRAYDYDAAKTNAVAKEEAKVTDEAFTIFVETPIEEEEKPRGTIEEIEFICRAIDQISLKLSAVKSQPLAYSLHFPTLMPKLKEVREMLWQGRAIADDPYCKGKGDKDGVTCTICRGTGKVIKRVAASGIRAVGGVK